MNNLMNKEDNLTLLKEYKKSKSLRIRDKIIINNLDLVNYQAHKYIDSYQQQEAFQEGCIGLMKAIEDITSTDNQGRVYFSLCIAAAIRSARYKWFRRSGIDTTKIGRKIYDNKYKLDSLTMTDIKKFARYLEQDLNVVISGLSKQIQIGNIDDSEIVIEDDPSCLVERQQHIINLTNIVNEVLTDSELEILYEHIWLEKELFNVKTKDNLSVNQISHKWLSIRKKIKAKLENKPIPCLGQGIQKGENSPLSKVTDKEIKEILYLINDWKHISKKEIAKMYRLSSAGLYKKLNMYKENNNE